MSESGKKENCAIECKDISSEGLDQCKSMKNTGVSLNESQDFHLVDFEDDTSADKEEKTQEVSHYPLTGNIDTTVNVPEATVVETKSTNSGEDQTFKKEDAENTQLPQVTEEKKVKDDNNTSTNKEELVDGEEEDIIECTPPDDYSPSKKQVLSITGVSNLKRKAGSFDEPPKKILKTISSEDMSMNEEKESQLFKADDTQADFPKNCIDINTIIAETQDVPDNEAPDMVTDKSVKDEQLTEDSKIYLESRVQEVDKNENFNDTLKPNETFTSKEAKDESEMNDLNEDVTSVSKGVTVEKVTSDQKNNANAMDLKPNEDSNSNTQDMKIVQDNKIDDKENDVESTRNLNEKPTETREISDPDKTRESHSNVNSEAMIKNRMSIELIYDRTAIQEIKTKPKELVEIDEDGEKIVLDSSEEDSDVRTDGKKPLDDTKTETIYKSCYDSKSSSDFSYKSVGTAKESSLESAKSSSKLVNGSSESKRCDTDSTSSLQSDTFNDIPSTTDKTNNNISIPVQSVHRQNKPVTSSKDSDLLSLSDNEPDVFIMDDKSKSNLTHSSSITKALQMEKEIGIYIRMKCLLQVEEGTKEFLSKEITGVQCEAVAEPTLIRQKNNDTSASLADISGNDNKDVSPGSINSNPQMYPLNPSRLSFASTISSLSSVSSAASLAVKLAMRDSTHF